MIIAIDDSGDPGLKLGRGSSSYFVIAAVLFKDDLDAEETALKIKRLRQSLGWKPQHEFKFRKTSPEIRKQFLSEVRKCAFDVSIVALEKDKYKDDRTFVKNASKFYNATILEAIRGFGTDAYSAHIIIDGENGSSYRRNVKTFFRQNLPKDVISQLVYRDSANDNLVQLADMIVGSMHRSLTKDKDSSYLRLIKKHIISLHTEL